MSYGTSQFGVTPYGAEEELAQRIVDTLLVEASTNVDQGGLIADILDLQGPVTHQTITTIMESTEWGDSHTVELVYALMESLAMSGNAQAMARMIGAINDQIALRDVSRLVLQELINDALAVDDEAFGDVIRLVALLDAMAITDAAGASVTTSIADALALAYVLRAVENGLISETANLTDTLQTLSTILAILAESVTFDDALTGLAIMTVVLEDDIALDDQVDVKGNYLASIAEGLGFSVSLVIDGIPYLGMCMNTESRGVTEYSNYSFNSLANFNGVLYGANDVGIFKLEGDTDAGSPIPAYARTALKRIAGGLQARVDSAYIAYRSNGTLQLKVSISGAQGQRVSHVYDMVAVTAESSRPNRAKIGRGLKSAYWAFEIQNTGGSDFEVDVIEIHPLTLERRIP